MELLDLELTADRTHEKFGARVATECGGILIKADGIFGLREAAVIAHAVLRGIEIQENRSGESVREAFDAYMKSRRREQA